MKHNVREHLLRSRRVQCVAVLCCSVWQCVVLQLCSWASAALSEGAVCCSVVLQCVAVLRIEPQLTAKHHLITKRTHHLLTNRCSRCVREYHITVLSALFVSICCAVGGCRVSQWCVAALSICCAVQSAVCWGDVLQCVALLPVRERRRRLASNYESPPVPGWGI